MKILWAIDAFDGLEELNGKAADYLRDIGTHQSLAIEPVFVLSPGQLGVPVELSARWSDQYLPAAEKALKQKLKDVTITGLLPGKVLMHESESLKGAVDALIRHAVAGKFDLIVTGSHGRSGLKRMFLGSFAETLLLMSSIPVMVVGGAAEKARPIKHILFPTDFSFPSAEMFAEVLKLAEQLGAKLTLLHAIARPIEPAFQSGVYLMSGGWVPIPLFMKKEHDRQKEIAERWAKTAARHRVSFEYVIDDEASSVTDSILRHVASGDVSLLAMAAQSGPAATVLAGSITRQIVRLSSCPVWVLRPKK